MCAWCPVVGRYSIQGVFLPLPVLEIGSGSTTPDQDEGFTEEWGKNGY